MLVGCKASTASNVKFVEFQASSSQCGFQYLGSADGLKICMINGGVAESTFSQAQQLAKEAASQWIDALTQYHPELTTTPQILTQNCDGEAFQTIDVVPGNSRATSGPGAPLTLYAGSMTLGVILHEFGHSLACLDDTYDKGTGIAGDCIAGQPTSIMCTAGYLNDATLYPDDIAGINSNYDKYANHEGVVSRPYHTDAEPPDGSQATDTTLSSTGLEQTAPPLTNDTGIGGGEDGSGSLSGATTQINENPDPYCADVRKPVDQRSPETKECSKNILCIASKLLICSFGG